MTGTPVIDFDSDEGSEYLENYRSIPTPRAERADWRYGSEWADLSTPELLGRMSDGLCARLLPGTHRATSKTRAFSDMSLTAMARIALERNGRTGYTGPGGDRGGGPAVHRHARRPRVLPDHVRLR